MIGFDEDNIGEESFFINGVEYFTQFDIVYPDPMNKKMEYCWAEMSYRKYNQRIIDWEYDKSYRE